MSQLKAQQVNSEGCICTCPSYSFIIFNSFFNIDEIRINHEATYEDFMNFFLLICCTAFIIFFSHINQQSM